MAFTLRSLPRDTRDTLFMLCVIAGVMAPQITRLPLWCSLMVGGILLWRGMLAWHNKPLPSRWWLLGMLLLSAIGTWSTYRTMIGRDAGVTFLLVLLALKTLELRAQRDAFVIFFLGFFAVLSNFFFSQSLLTALTMMLALWGLLTALVNSHMPVGHPPLLQAARVAAYMCVVGAPIMVVLFMLFPRIAPLWGMPEDSATGRSGLSNTMQVGSIASLALDESIAMRIRFETKPPAQNALYFRGPVLSTFDGREWTALRSAFTPDRQLARDLVVDGPAVRYEVTLNPHQGTWLPVLDATANAPEIQGFQTIQGPDLQWQTNRPVTEMLRFSVTSHTRFRHGPGSPVLGLQDYLALPPGFNPRTLQLASELRRQPDLATAQASTLVDAVLNRLRTGGYTYTLSPGLYGTHSADEFWFDRKTGFCEHIAASFVILMRALDVPARIVTGYQGGQINAVDGFWTVRHSDAHAWAEVWMGERGWVRVDPTSAVAPGRTGSFERLAPPATALRQVFGVVVGAQISLNLRALWEATNNRWNQWVLNYSQAQQMELLRGLGFSSPDWYDLSRVLGVLIMAFALLGAGWNWWIRQRQDPWLRLLHAAQQKLRATGIPMEERPCTPRSLIHVLQSRADASPAALDWLLRLERWRYAHQDPTNQQAKHTLATLRKQLRHLQWLTSASSDGSPDPLLHRSR